MSGVWGDNSAFNTDIDNPFGNIDLKIAGLSLSTGTEGDNDDVFNTKSSPDVLLGNNDEEINPSIQHFDFDKLLKYQYIEFSDYDIPQIIDLILSLPKSYPHISTYPAALLFQCIRYADHKKESPSLVDSLFNLSMTSILSSISSNHQPLPNTDLNSSADNNNNSNATNNNSEPPRRSGDIVVITYWFSTFSFLYYYFCKDESFFRRYPTLLQELINTLNSLMIQLISSIHSRLEPLIDPTILQYTTIQDVKQTLYKQDWNFFKKRRQMKAAHQAAERMKEKSNSPYLDDEMLKHLYPPSLEEQMKPSPMKIVQIFGALVYVLDLHEVHPLYQQQCLSMAVQWFSTSLFNKIIKDRVKKSLSRAHAIQIRLNLDTLDTWIKNNDLTVEKPLMIDDFMWQLFPYTLLKDVNEINLNVPTLRNIIMYTPKIVDPKQESNTNNDFIYNINNTAFYYQSFHRIAQIHLEPVYQLLQWLQVATTLNSEESLDSTISLLQRLTPVQLLKSIEHYSYELDEHKFKSALRKKLSTICKMEIHKNDAYLQERVVPSLALPTVPELTDTYSRVKDKSKSYQPFLPVDIEDAAFEIHDKNYKARRDAIYSEPEESNSEDENDEENNEESSKKENSDENSLQHAISKEKSGSPLDNEGKEEFNWSEPTKNDNVFDAPSSTNHKDNSWKKHEFEANPW
ncbi:hypothetical protein Kpol_538p9 [Vanderwaltozyma polyspora DSM 70294]|uniref:Dilute domain-containing protein n=1 Tax=Vanderwaltozyma polyspora (strain ATCC 22028 / DSM 70294 / BCRC 21397 / CBS 2163 / NBRC 10782 / NRRL Y-8283 / UCD 57-17) TaxID=436907 RepID=A7TKC2_VANPO|nr:uncharacterized protein Kpol_538p9 [Vanderwaltozyma polyspora DSM 70294]EDO17249.1 hypothetical protein Kpol_538p9 [Vanderwaltozyma polyspora DSM 70294]